MSRSGGLWWRRDRSRHEDDRGRSLFAMRHDSLFAQKTGKG